MSEQDKASTGAHGKMPTHVLASLLIIVGELIVVVATRFPWLTITASDDKQGEVVRTLTGATWVSVLFPFALVAAAGVCVSLTVRAAGRRVAGGLVAAAGLGSTVAALKVLITSPDAERAKDLLVSGAASQKKTDIQTIAQWATIEHISVHTGWVILTVVASLIATVGGVLFMVRPGVDRSHGNRFQRGEERARSARKDLDALGQELDNVDATSLNGAGGKGSGTDSAGMGRLGSRGASTSRTGSTDTSNRVFWDAIDAGLDPTDRNSSEH